MADRATDRTVDLSVEQLVDRARGLVRPGRRVLLGITGAPGAGKSTVAAALLDALGEQAVLVGMDGFHLASSELVRIGRRDRKGAPDTFDVDGYVALLRRLRAQADPVVYAPVFDRALEESIGSAVPVPVSTPLVITEGNYLLLETDGWAAVRSCLDEVWFLDAQPALRRDRLVARRQSYGEPLPHSQAWVRGVDEANAALVEGTRAHADLVVRVGGPLALP
jgi:pantothenate kinase